MNEVKHTATEASEDESQAPISTHITKKVVVSFFDPNGTEARIYASYCHDDGLLSIAIPNGTDLRTAIVYIAQEINTLLSSDHHAIFYIPANEITENQANQPRGGLDRKHVEYIKDHFSNELLDPIRINIKGEVIAGFHRIRAVKEMIEEAKLRSDYRVPIMLVQPEMEQFFAMVTNENSRPFTPVEQGRNYRKIYELKVPIIMNQIVSCIGHYGNNILSTLSYYIGNKEKAEEIVNLLEGLTTQAERESTMHKHVQEGILDTHITYCIAKEFGKPKSFVEGRMNLLELSSHTMYLLEHNAITLEMALCLGSFIKRYRDSFPESFEENIVKKLVDDKFTKRRLEFYLNSLVGNLQTVTQTNLFGEESIIESLQAFEERIRFTLNEEKTIYVTLKSVEKIEKLLEDSRKALHSLTLARNVEAVTSKSFHTKKQQKELEQMIAEKERIVEHLKYFFATAGKMNMSHHPGYISPMFLETLLSSCMEKKEET